MLSRYLGTFLLALAIVCGILSVLPFATRSQVRAGAVLEEAWVCELTLEADGNQTYVVSERGKADLEKGIAFIGSGVVQVRTTRVEITPQEVSWKRDKTTYTAPGAKMVARVTWETPAEFPEPGTGDIHIEFPEVRGIAHFTPAFHSGNYQRTGDGRWVFREVRAYRGTVALLIGRFFYVLSAGLPITIVLHAIWWGIQLSREKKVRVAALATEKGAGSGGLPRVFYPNPIAEWVGWTFAVAIFGLVGSMLAMFTIFSGFLSTSMGGAMMIMEGVGVFIGLIVVAIARAKVVTVRIDNESIAYAKGRGEPRWITARWEELKGTTVKTQVYKGNTTEWLEIRFPDGKVRKIPSSVVDYAGLKELVRSRG